MTPNGINLIPLPRRQMTARRYRAHCWLAASACYGLILISGYTLCITSAGSDVDATGAALQKSNRQIDDLNNTLSTLRPQLAEMQAKLAVARTMGDQPDWSLLLAIISSTLDDEIVLSSTRLETADAPNSSQRRIAAPSSRPASDVDSKLNISLQGFARSQAAVTQFVLRLERLGLFERVEMVNSSRQQFGTNGNGAKGNINGSNRFTGEVTAFRIEGELRRNGTGATGAAHAASVNQAGAGAGAGRDGR